MRAHVAKGRIAILIAFCVSMLYAQEFRGTFSGLIKDAQGAAIAKAKITATEESTGVKTSTVSSETGEYTIPFLAPGEYEITAEFAGFKTYRRTGLTLNIGDHPVVDIPLEVGEANQSVVVTAEAPLLE